MNIAVQILIGASIGLIFGFLTLSATINNKENELKAVWGALSDALNERYRTLRKILYLMGEYMGSSESEISALSELCSNAIDEMTDLSHFNKRLHFENLINDKLENIKYQMENHPELLNNEKYNDLIKEISEKEGYVGEAIRIYNASLLEFKVLMETFPFSAACWILNKNTDSYGAFNVMQMEDFNKEFVDEETI